MNARRGWFLSVCLVLLFSVFLLPASGLAEEDYSAGTMRLLRYDGDVTILNSEGVPRFVMEDVRFSSGEIMQTGEESLASVGLDDQKIVTLDALTEVQFVQEDQHIRLNLNQGTLFLDVRESLDENEGLDIQTTTMTVGIRGTVVFLSQDPASEIPGAPAPVTRFGVLEGTAEVDYMDRSGASRRLPVSAGQLLTIREDENGAGVAPSLAPITREDIAGFVSDVVNADPVLQERIPPLTEDATIITGDLPADGNWIYPGTVTLVAQSASKLYDGLPLTRPSNALVYDLPAGFSINVVSSGSLVNAGTAENVISSWRITNIAGEDVTSHFPNVTTLPGSLVVNQVPLVVWTGSAEKVYDGTPLTEPEAGIRTVEGYVSGDPDWLNTSLVTESALGSERMFALSGHTFVQGTNPLTGEPKDIDLPVGYSLSVLLHNGDEGQSIEFKVEPVKEEDLPAEVLRLYAANPDMLARACEDAGWDPELMAELIAALPEEEEPDASVNVSGLQVSSASSDQIMTDSANVRIQVDSGLTNYNSRPLTNQEARFTPIVLDPSITVIATGSQTEVGTSENTYEITWNTANPNNYTIREELGTLTVTEAPKKNAMPAVTFTASSASKVYDGSPLTAAEVTAAGLPAGYTFSAVASGSITDIGSAANTVSSVTILDPSGNDATSLFKNITLTPGTLTVEPLSVSVSLGDGSTTYSGSTYVPVPVLEYQNGPHAGETVSAVRIADSRTRRLLIASTAGLPSPMSGSMRFLFTLFTGDVVDLTVSGSGTGAGTYSLSSSVSSSANISFTNSSEFSSDLVIEPAVLEITTSSASKAYDGTALTSAEVTVKGLSAGDKITVAATGSQTAPGSSSNTYTIDWGSVSSANYTVRETLGTLSVTKSSRPVTVTVTGRSSTANYDGESHTVSGYDVEFSNPLYTAADFTFTGTASASRSDAGTAYMGLSEDQFKNISDNFDEVTFVVTDGYQVINPVSAVVTITGHHAASAYDGSEHTVSGYDVEFSTPLYTADDFTFTGAAEAKRTDKGTTPMGLSEDMFTNINGNFAGVTFRVTDGYQTVTDIGEVVVTVTGHHDSVPFDGAEHTVSGYDVEISNPLYTAADFAFSGTASAARTDAGTANMNLAAAQFANTNPNFDTVTFNVTDGWQTVTPVDVTVTITGHSAAEEYDNANYQLEGYDVAVSNPLYTEADFAFSGSAAASGTIPGTYAMGLSESQFANNNPNFNASFSVTDGVLTVTKNTSPVTITLLDYSEVYSGAEVFGYNAESDVAGLDDSRFWAYASGGASLTDVGSVENPVAEYVIGLRTTEEDVTEYFSNVTLVPGTLSVTPAPLSVTTPNDYRTYDGNPLPETTDAPTLSGLVNDETAEISLEENQLTDAGTKPNQYFITWLTAKLQNYFVNSETLGTLSVTRRPVTLTSASGSKAYDGTPLTNHEVAVSGYGFAYGEGAEYTFTGSQTDVGSSDNTFTYTLTSGTKANNYDISTVTGTLEVTQREVTVTVTGHTSSVQYSGGEQTVEGYDLSVADDLYPLSAVSFSGAAVAAGTTPGTYYMGLEPANFSNTNPNFDVTFVIASDGALTVTPADVTVTIAGRSETVQYDGEEHWVEGYDVVSISNPAYTSEDFDIIDAADEAGGTIPGTYPMELEEDLFINLNETGLFNNVTFVVTDGALTITNNTDPITVAIGDFSTTYDGNTYTGYNAEPSVTGLDTAKFSITITPTAELKDVGVVPINVSYVITTLEGGENVTAYFSNVNVSAGSLYISPAPLSVTTLDESKVYDGNPLPETTDSPRLEGLINDEIAYAYHKSNQLTKAGSKSNEYYIEWVTADEGNYSIPGANVTLGTLTISKLNISIQDAGEGFRVNYQNDTHGWNTHPTFVSYSFTETDSGFTATGTGVLETGDTLTFTKTVVYSDDSTATTTYAYSLSNDSCYNVSVPDTTVEPFVPYT